MTQVKDFIKEKGIVIYDLDTSVDRVLTLRLVRTWELKDYLDEFINNYLSNLDILSINYESDFIVIAAKYTLDDTDIFKALSEMRLSNIANKFKKLLLDHDLLNKECLSTYNNTYLSIKLKEEEYYIKPEPILDTNYIHIEKEDLTEKGCNFLMELYNILYFQIGGIKEVLNKKFFHMIKEGDTYIKHSLVSFVRPISNKPIIEEAIIKEVLKELKIINIIKLGLNEFEPVFNIKKIEMIESDDIRRIRIPLKTLPCEYVNRDYKLVSEFSDINTPSPKLDKISEYYVNRLREVGENNWRLNLNLDLDENLFYINIIPHEEYFCLYEKEFNLNKEMI